MLSSSFFNDFKKTESYLNYHRLICDRIDDLLHGLADKSDTGPADNR